MKVDLRDYRINERGMSVHQLAELLEVSPDVVRNLELTGNAPRPANALKIAQHFQMTVTEMWPELAKEAA